MDADSDQLQLKKILVDLEDEQQHLEASINHLKNEIDKREVEVRLLFAERELELTRENQSVDFHKLASGDQGDILTLEHSQEFVRQVNQILDKIGRTAEEVSALIKL